MLNTVNTLKLILFISYSRQHETRDCRTLYPKAYSERDAT